MILAIKNDIENNIFSTEITIDSFGTENLTSDEEKETLKDFPTKIIYRNLDFSRKFNVNGNTPVITDDDSGTEVRLSLTNQEIYLSEDLNITYRIDSNKIVKAELNDTLNSPWLVAQAKCMVFTDVVVEEIQRIMNDIRIKGASFIGEREVEI